MENFRQSDYEIIKRAKRELDVEFEKALDKFHKGRELPLDKRMEVFIERITQSI